jgi:hypothetical protein
MELLTLDGMGAIEQELEHIKRYHELDLNYVVKGNLYRSTGEQDRRYPERPTESIREPGAPGDPLLNAVVGAPTVAAAYLGSGSTEPGHPRLPSAMRGYLWLRNSRMTSTSIVSCRGSKKAPKRGTEGVVKEAQRSASR